jgi:putative membrane protein
MLLTFSVAGVGAQGAGAQPQMKSASMPAPSAAFLKTVDEGGQAEIALATAVEGKTANSQVKTLAQTIRQDHTAANAEIEALAREKGVTLPTAVSHAHQATADRITKLSGSALDKAYVAEMITDHRADIAEFQKHEKDPEPAVAAWVAKTLPTLRTHLKMAEDAQKSISGS